MKKWTKEEVIAHVSQAIASCTATLITVDGDGLPRARALEDHNPYPGFEFWFGTHIGTRKVDEIRAHPKVAVYYEPPTVAGYICIMGTARIRDDAEGRRFLWRPEWSKHYDGPMAPEFVPIQLLPDQVEFYDTHIGACAEDGFGPVVVEL
jgi:general stress protein 26